MENNEFIKRAEDLWERCERSGVLTMTGFLSPAERYQLECWAARLPDGRPLFHGGAAGCERTAAFFLPDYMAPEDFDPAEHIRAIRLKAHFGAPGHRDYMGAVLGMGVGRQWVGDIRVMEDTAYIFCLPSVQAHLLSMDKVGRFSVRAEAVALSALPAQEKQVRSLSFSVMSPRLDAVVGGMFHLSRTESAKQISAGNVSLNYEQCLRADCRIKEGDVISLRGGGKGSVTGTGGTSRKGRLFVYADIYK